MRAVITGTDYIKDIDGSFKAIETNTNVGLSLDATRYFDIDTFASFVSDNGFNEIVVIFNDVNDQIFSSVTELEEANPNYEKPQQFVSFLKSFYSGSSITVDIQKLTANAVTIPDVDDSDTKLIVRLAYDTTALIDDTYARDNWEFLKLMNDADPNSIAKTYINDSELGFDSIGTTLRDNGNHPNYCIKKRITPTDNNIYPKLYKISTIEELNNLKLGLEVDEYIQEYIYNPSDTLNNKVKVYRSVDMVYGGELDVMNLWIMEHTALLDTIGAPDYDDNNQVQIWDRVRYTTKYNAKTSDIAIKFSADEDTKILDVNNQIVTVQDLNVGDWLKSVSIPGMISETAANTLWTWSGSSENIMLNSFVTQSQLVSKAETDYFGEIIEITLENGSVFSDVPHGTVLIETEVSGSKIAIFKEYSQFELGDTILIWDNQTDTIIKQNVVNIGYSYQKLKAYTLNIEDFDLFLTLEESNQNRYGLITHNYNYDCRNIACPGDNLTGGTVCNTGAFIAFCQIESACVRVGGGNTVFYNCVDYAPQIIWTGSFTYTIFTCQFQNTLSLGSYCNNQKPSDINLKENTKFLYKTKDGLQVYEFEFNEKIKDLWMSEKNEDLSGKWRGVMAQELVGTKWESALKKHNDGFYIVDYAKLPKLN